MKYKITVQVLITEDYVEKEWMQVDPYKDEDGNTKTYNYVDITKTRSKDETIYEQVKNSDAFDLKAVIDSFNK